MRTIDKYRRNRDRKKQDANRYNFPIARHDEISSKLNEILTILRNMTR